jgi:hypothetical protein
MKPGSRSLSCSASSYVDSQTVLGERKSIRSYGPGCLRVDGNFGINYPGPLNRWWSDVTTHATIFFNPV